MPKIADYESIISINTIEELRLLAGKLQGNVIQNINSTALLVVRFLRDINE